VGFNIGALTFDGFIRLYLIFGFVDNWVLGEMVGLYYCLASKYRFDGYQ
jgi:hypothetical protein